MCTVQDLLRYAVALPAESACSLCWWKGGTAEGCSVGQGCKVGSASTWFAVAVWLVGLLLVEFYKAVSEC